MLTEANMHEDQHHGRDADQDLPSTTTQSKQPIKIRIIHGRCHELSSPHAQRIRTMQVTGETTN
jgi:hypothetical protein